MREERTLERVTGSKEEIIRELMRLAEGWQHLGNARLYDACMAGIRRMQIEPSPVEVTVGHTVYVAEHTTVS